MFGLVKVLQYLDNQRYNSAAFAEVMKLGFELKNSPDTLREFLTEFFSMAWRAVLGLLYHV